MRRAVPSFTVEVRRRPRLATHSSQDLQLCEPKTRPAAFENESHRLAARTFGAAKTPNRPSGDGAASYPQRRILPSLVPEKPPGGQPQDAFSSAGASHPMSHAQKPTSAAPIKGKDHISASPRNLEASSELNAQLADRGDRLASTMIVGYSEVRRRPRLATHSSQDLQLSEPKTRPAAFENEFSSSGSPNIRGGQDAKSTLRRWRRVVSTASNTSEPCP